MHGAMVEAARAAYRIDGSDEEWLARLLSQVVLELGARHGAWVATYDASGDRGLSLGALAGERMFPGWETAVRLGVGLVPASQRRRAMSAGACATLSQILGVGFLRRPPTSELLRAIGGCDALGLNARDPSGRGVIFAVSLDAVGSVAPTDVARWERIAAHVAAGWRLRRTLKGGLGGPLVGAEAVLERDGRLCHAERWAEPARPALRDAAKALSQAAEPCGDVDRLFDGWQGLVAGRWTLIDHFDTDGRRYYIARKNDPAAPGHAALTGRQRQIVGFAALGHPNKLIAYELGLSEAAVSTHLRRAAERLGVASRQALIAAFAASAGAPEAVDERAPADADPTAASRLPPLARDAT